jgi:precorrin-3B methylase
MQRAAEGRLAARGEREESGAVVVCVPLRSVSSGDDGVAGRCSTAMQITTHQSVCVSVCVCVCVLVSASVSLAASVPVCSSEYR